MSGKTQNQILQEIEKEKLVHKSKEILTILSEEEVSKALSILDFCIQKINNRIQEKARQTLVKEIWPEDFNL